MDLRRLKVPAEEIEVSALALLLISILFYRIGKADLLNLKKKSKVVPYSIMSIGHRADPSFLAVSPQMTVINPVVGCCYFPPGMWLLPWPKRSPPG